MIRPRLIQDLRAAIDSSQYFLADDFHIETEDTRDGFSTLGVRYRFNEAYYLVAAVPLAASNGQWFEISMTVKPGSIADTEVLTVGAWEQVVHATQNWLARIHEELQAVPVARDLADHKKDLEALLHSYENLPDEYFTRTEAADMEVRLDEVEARIEDHLRDRFPDPDVVKTRTAAIRQDLRTLKETLRSLKKQHWVGKLLVRVSGWLRDPENRQVLRTGADVASTLLNTTSGPPRARRSWPSWLVPQQDEATASRPRARRSWPSWLVPQQDEATASRPRARRSWPSWLVPQQEETTASQPRARRSWPAWFLQQQDEAPAPRPRLWARISRTDTTVPEEEATGDGVSPAGG